MRRLFVRTYAVLVAVVLAGLLVALAWDVARRQGPDPAVIEALLSGEEVVRAAFADAEPEQARRSVGQALQADVHVRPLHPLPPLPPPARERLARGQVLRPRAGRAPDLWVPLPDQGLLVHLVPRQARPPPLPWIAIGVLLALGVATGAQLRPLERDLQRLAHAAQAFGAGDRQVRVRLDPHTPAGELGGRFDAMADRIAGLLASREELLRSVSHELRTPLHRLRFAAQLLATEPDPQAREAQLEALQRDLDELDALVGELLAWGRLDHAGPGRWEPVPLSPLLQELLTDAVRLRPGLCTEGPIGPTTQPPGDPALLRRALSNLITNAARHATSRIAVIVEATDHAVTIHVDDDGPGIPAEDRRRVLEPFVRLDDARSRDAGGAGLGLALADRVAQAHRGTLEVDRAALGGARLSLRLPLTNADSG